MICFNCGIKLHRNELDECQLCGVKFAGRCSACGMPNPYMAKYCFNCGSILNKTSMQSSVQNFDVLTENRKNVAVIFADVSGFTALSEKLDPEEVRELINDCFTYITRPVYELEGTIDKYIGDCIMILFGAKYSHPDDAKRAVFCAMRMMDLIKEFSRERLVHKDFHLSLSVGVNYGLVVTGSVGNYFDKDYTVMGDIVNTAQRLQVSAESQTILVSESVCAQTKDVINYSAAKEIQVKNKKDLVRCFSPLSINSKFSPDSRIPLVERENEVGILNSTYESILNTSTRGLMVVGEAGIGKTSVIKEFISKLGDDIKKVWVDCSTSAQNRGYFVISSMLMGVMNLNSTDSRNVKQHRLASFLDYILSSLSDEDIKRNYDFLSLVMGLSRDNEFNNILNSMSFENIKREMLKQLIVFFTYLCNKYKVIFVIDDMHWSDVASIDILRELLPSLPSTNSMLIFTSRYEIKGLRFDSESECQLLRLGPLSENGIGDMAAMMIGCAKVDKSLLEVAVRFTGGVPLYVREFILNINRNDSIYLQDNTAYFRGEKINHLPVNIQGIILANISELDDTSKSFLEAAAVIGKDFSLSVVGSLLDCELNETIVLRLPIQLNIIALKAVHTSAGSVEKVFTFKHDMERETIYEGILNKKKRELHRRVGEVLEIRHSREIESYYDVIGEHFYIAGMSKKACDYFYKAAVEYKNSFNFTGALEYYNKFLKMTESSENSEINTRKMHAFIDVGYIKFVMADYDAAKVFFNKALGIAYLSDDIYYVNILIADVYKQQGFYNEALEIINDMQPKLRQDNSMYGRLLQMKCNILRITGNPEALSIAKKSESILLKTRDYQSLSETMNQAGIIYFIKGEIENSLFYLNKSYKYAEKTNNLEIMAKVSGNLGIIYHSTGEVSKALGLFEASISISRKISDQQGFVSGCINLGILYMDKGKFGKAEELFDEALYISREISSRLYECISLTNLGELMYEKGEYEKTLNFYNSSAELAKSIHIPVEEGVNYLGLARLCLKKGSFEEVPELLEYAFNIFNDAGEIVYLSDYYRLKGEYELLSGDTFKALEYCDKAIAASKECKSDIRNIRAYMLEGEIFRCKEEHERSLKSYEAALNLAAQIESDYELAIGHFGRYKSYIALEQKAEAHEELSKAVEHINKVDPCLWGEIIKDVSRKNRLKVPE
jgi:adenylate cyclase